MKFAFVVLLVFVLFSSLCLALELSEVYPNPIGSDNNNEFVEVVGHGNLSEYIVGDLHSNDTLVLLQQGSSNYSLIVEEGFVYRGSATTYSVGPTIGNGLSNSADTVFLYDPLGTLVDTVSYDGVGEGESWAFNGTMWSFGIIGGTPGEANRFAVQEDIINAVSLEIVLDETLYVDAHYDKGFRINNHLDFDVDVVLAYNVTQDGSGDDVVFFDTLSFGNITSYKTKDTVSLQFSEAGNYTLCGSVFYEGDEDLFDNSACQSFRVIDMRTVSCDRSIALLQDELVFADETTISFTPTIGGEYDDLPFVYSYYISELGGDIVKAVRNSTSTAAKKWTPDLGDGDAYGVYVFVANLTDTTCIDTSLENNVAKKTFIVSGSQKSTSSVSIEHVYLGSDSIARAGDIISARVLLYSGNVNSTDNDVFVYVENSDGHLVSKKTTLRNVPLYKELDVTLPLALSYDCSQSYPLEEYTVIVDGLGKHTREQFSLAGISRGLCAQTGEYTNVFLPTLGLVGDNVTSSLVLRNIDVDSHTYKVSSKIYRGPKTYSGDFFANMEKITLEPGDDYEVDLISSLLGLDAGEYSIKIQVQRDARKTFEEFRGPIKIIDLSTDELFIGEVVGLNKSKEYEESVVLENASSGSSAFAPITGAAVGYEGTFYKTKSLLSYFLIGLLLFIIFVLGLSRAQDI